MDQTLHRVATEEREEIKRTAKQKMARRRNGEGGNHLDQESNRKKIMEDTDGGLHPAVDRQSLDEDKDEDTVVLTTDCVGRVFIHLLCLCGEHHSG